MGLFDKAKEFAGKNPDKVEGGVEKAGDMVDEKTGGQYEGQVDQAQEFATDQLTGDEGGGQGGGGDAGGDGGDGQQQ